MREARNPVRANARKRSVVASKRYAQDSKKRSEKTLFTLILLSIRSIVGLYAGIRTASTNAFCLGIRHVVEYGQFINPAVSPCCSVTARSEHNSHVIGVGRHFRPNWCHEPAIFVEPPLRVVGRYHDVAPRSRRRRKIHSPAAAVGGYRWSVWQAFAAATSRRSGRFCLQSVGHAARVCPPSNQDKSFVVQLFSCKKTLVRVTNATGRRFSIAGQ